MPKLCHYCAIKFGTFSNGDIVVCDECKPAAEYDLGIID